MVLDDLLDSGHRKIPLDPPLEKGEELQPRQPERPLEPTPFQEKTLPIVNMNHVSSEM